MKRLSEKQKIRHSRLLRHKYSNKLARGAITIMSEINRLKELHPMTAIRSKGKQIIIHAPASMVFNESDKEKILDFLRCIRDFIKAKFVKKSIDFSTIKFLSPLCAMLLISEVHRWQLILGTNLRVNSIDDWDPTVRQLLNDIGLFDLVDVSNKPNLPEIDTEEKFIKIRSRQKVDLEKAIGLIENEVENIGLTIDENPKLYGGIEEAITNVTQWAYHENYKFDYNNTRGELYNRWWFCASYNKKEGKVTVMVQDHGLGIPITLGASNWWERIKELLEGETNNDGKIINAVMNIPRSASGEDYRAKGLVKMRQLLSRFYKGKLTIMSGKGWYEFRHNKDDINQNSANENYGLHKHSIYGTLVIWEIYPIWK